MKTMFNLKYQAFLFTAVLAFFYTETTVAQDLWIQRDSVGGPGKCAVAAFAIGQKGFIGFGNSDDGFKRSLYEYDPIQDDWDKMESLGGPAGGGLERATPVGFSINNKAYVGLGNGNSAYNRDFWEYDPITNTWTQKADFGGTARRQAVGFAIGGLGYVGTGIDMNGYTSDFWEYNPTTNAWIQRSNFGGGNRKQAVGFSMGSKGYIGTGDNGGFSNDFWEYDPSSDNWTAKASFPGTPRYAATAVGSWPDAIIGLGYDNTLSYKADLYRYDALTDSWTQLQDFIGGARSNAAGFVIQRHAYIGCGYTENGQFVDDFYEYGTLINVDKIADAAQIQTTVYPNPVQTTCTIELNGLKGNDLNIQVYNAIGQDMTALVQPILSDYSAPKFQLSTHQIPEGNYFYSIKQDGNKVYSGQLTVAR